MKSSLTQRLLAVTLLITASASGQTLWLKYEGNPVIVRGPADAWDDASVYPNSVMFQDTLFRMWYTGWDGTKFRTGLATSPNGFEWTKVPQNPVLNVGPGSWDQGASYEGYVVAADSGYEMWYTGGDGLGNWKLGHAHSPNGIDWVKTNSANPVLGTGSWYTKGPHNPSVYAPDSGGYRMWFQGNPLAHSNVQIGYATAIDETTWTALAGPVFSFDAPGTWDDDKVMCPKVLHSGDRYEMWYAGERLDGVTDIGYATSLDGITWARHTSNPVMRHGPAAWELLDLYSLDVTFDGTMYHMWYGGKNSVSWPNGVGYAVSPRGSRVGAVSDNMYLGDSLFLRVSVDDPNGLSFQAEVELNGVVQDTIELFDQGLDGDSLAGDGSFAGVWFLTSSGSYTVDLRLHLENQAEAMWFEMDNAWVFAVTATGVSQELQVPSDFRLFQNHPNPFNPATVIQYTVAAPSEGLSLSKDGAEGRNVIHQVRLSVFDLLGREVAVLVDEKKPGGTHTATWDASGFPSGVYFYRLQAGDFVDTKKLILMR